MQRLSTHEICPGTGCLVVSNGVWRRAVISSCLQPTGFNVKFIDTGAYHEILSDSVSFAKKKKNTKARSM